MIFPPPIVKQDAGQQINWNNPNLVIRLKTDVNTNIVQPVLLNNDEAINLDFGINSNAITATLHNAHTLTSIPPPQQDLDALALSLSQGKVSLFAAQSGADLAILRHTPQALAYHLGVLMGMY